jgi:hypothetical protein
MAMSPALQEAPLPPIPPIPPIPPLPPGVSVSQGGGAIILQPGTPLTSRDVAMLRQRGRELSNQLTSASSRREDLARALEDASGVNRQGLEQRIAQLDGRIMTIEAAIAENGRLLAMAPPSARETNTSTAPAPPNPLGLSSGQITAISIVGTIFVLFPLALAMARNIWRRGTKHVPVPQSSESPQRMERLEQAVDAIAIEVERISEGQRFVTRLLTEGSAPALSVGQKSAEPVRLPELEPLRASRESA